MSATEPVWRCDRCGEPISAGSGHVVIHDKDIRLAARWLDGAGDQPGRWHAYHVDHDPFWTREEDDGCCWVPVEYLLRSEAELVGWADHVARKSWAAGTNWPGFLAQHGASSAAFRARTIAVEHLNADLVRVDRMIADLLERRMSASQDPAFGSLVDRYSAEVNAATRNRKRLAQARDHAARMDLS